MHVKNVPLKLTWNYGTHGTCTWTLAECMYNFCQCTYEAGYFSSLSVGFHLFFN